MTPDTCIANLDSYIYRYRAQHAGATDPPSLTITQEQAGLLEKWAAGRRHFQDKVTVNESGHVKKYRGISVTVRGR